MDGEQPFRHDSGGDSRFVDRARRSWEELQNFHELTDDELRQLSKSTVPGFSQEDFEPVITAYSLPESRAHFIAERLRLKEITLQDIGITQEEFEAIVLKIKKAKAKAFAYVILHAVEVLGSDDVQEFEELLNETGLTAHELGLPERYETKKASN